MGLLFRIVKYVVLAAFGLHVLYFLVILSFSFAFDRINPSASTLMLYRKYFYRHDIKEVLFIPIDKIKPWIPRLLVESEDKGFFQHHGIEPDALKRAFQVNKNLGGFYLGGSTITQQLSRTLFLVPSKNYLRKYLEIIASLTMELVLPKKRILELYLNYVEFGKGVFGLGQAARTHFDKPLENLTGDEVLKLITILPSPLNYTPRTFHKSSVLEDRYRSLQKGHPGGK